MPIKKMASTGSAWVEYPLSASTGSAWQPITTVFKSTITYVGERSLGSFTASATLTQPTGIAAGDIGLLQFDSTNVAYNPPAGWTQLFGNVYYRVYAAGQGSIVLASSNGTASSVAATLQVYRGVDNTKPISAVSGKNEDYSTALSYAGPSVTSTDPDAALITIARANRNGAAPIITAPVGSSNGSTRNFNVMSLGMARMPERGYNAGEVAAGPTWTVGSAPYVWYTVNVLLNPA